MNRLLIVLPSFVLLACGSVSTRAPDGGGGGGSGGTPTQDGGAGTGGGGGPDTTPPTVVSISPADHATGVASDATIVITFSEPMNQAATQAAYQSAGVPAGAAVLTWDAQGTVLTITPNAPLPYATGSDPTAVTATTFSILVTTTATDAAGNHLAANFNASFSTLRRISTPIQTLVVGLTGTVYSGQVIGDGARLIVGDTSNTSFYKGLITFDITSLPAGIHQIEAGTLRLNFDGVSGAPFPSLGAVNVDQITFAMRSTAFAAISRRGFGALPIASNTDLGWKAVDVLAGVVDDYTNRTTLGNLSQYRLTTAVPNNGDTVFDYYHFDIAPIAELDVVYTID